MAARTMVVVSLLAFVALVVVQSASLPIKVHSYLDAFCGSEQTTELYKVDTCMDNGEGSYSMYMVDGSGVSHCDWDNAACLGESVRCVKDGRVSGKCYQTSLTSSKKFEFDTTELHSLSFVEQASSSSSARSSSAARSSSGRASSTGRAPVYSSTGSAPQPISGLTLSLYANSSYCNYVSGTTTYGVYYNVDRCYSPSSTLLERYYERITVTSGTGDDSRGLWCRYYGSGSGCSSSTLIGCTSWSIGTCTTDGVPYDTKASIRFSYGIDLAGLATLIIVIIVIAALVVVGSVITACCCGAAAAALLGRLCCGLCCAGRSSTHQGYVQHSSGGGYQGY